MKGGKRKWWRSKWFNWKEQSKAKEKRGWLCRRSVGDLIGKTGDKKQYAINPFLTVTARVGKWVSWMDWGRNRVIPSSVGLGRVIV